MADGDIQGFEQGAYAPLPAPPTGLRGAPLPACDLSWPRGVLAASGCLWGAIVALPMTPAGVLQQPGDRGCWVPAAITNLQQQELFGCKTQRTQF